MRLHPPLKYYNQISDCIVQCALETTNPETTQEDSSYLHSWTSAAQPSQGSRIPPPWPLHGATPINSQYERKYVRTCYVQSKGLHSHITLHKAGLHPSLATIGYPKVLYAGVGHHIKSCMVIVYACTSLICPQKGRVYIIQYVGTLHPHPYPHLHKEHTMHICMYVHSTEARGWSE